MASNPDLLADKAKLINKYDLELKQDGYWYVDKENAYPQRLFKDRFFQRNDLIIILFRIYKLCFAKVNYFRRNIGKYDACYYHYQQGFITTELWNADFFKHKKTGLIIDFRYLQSIKDIELFLALVYELEMTEEEAHRDQQFLSRFSALNSDKAADSNNNEA
jgi:hypothetical protein